MLIDSILEYVILSSFDTISGYYQILIKFKNASEFITDEWDFCYKVMHVGLKNTRAIYQQLIIGIFKALIGIKVEIYVDDVLIKSPLHTKKWDILSNSL